MYAIDEPLSFDRIHLFWLPYIRKLGRRNVPVVLVGNKTDRRDLEPPILDLEQVVVPIMSEFKQVKLNFFVIQRLKRASNAPQRIAQTSVRFFTFVRGLCFILLFHCMILVSNL